MKTLFICLIFSFVVFGQEKDSVPQMGSNIEPYYLPDSMIVREWGNVRHSEDSYDYIRFLVIEIYRNGMADTLYLGKHIDELNLDEAKKVLRYITKEYLKKFDEDYMRYKGIVQCD